VQWRDGQIRFSLHARLAEAHGREPDTRIQNELGLCQGATRVDVAVINGHLSGYEIKSDRDTLARLPKQVELYNNVLDFSWIVTTPRFAEKVDGYISAWWGLLVVEPLSESAVEWHMVRDAARNGTVNPISVAQLLWREEAMEELRQRSADRGLSRATRWVVWERLIETVTLAELQEIVRRRLKVRLSPLIG
jgi:hypothetical protein